MIQRKQWNWEERTGKGRVKYTWTKKKQNNSCMKFLQQQKKKRMNDYDSRIKRHIHIQMKKKKTTKNYSRHCMRIVFAASARVWGTWISISNRYLFNWKKCCAPIILHTSKVGKNLFSYISLFGFNSFKSIYPCTWDCLCTHIVLFCTFALQNALVFFRWGGLWASHCVCTLKVTKITWKIVQVQVKCGISQLHSHCVFVSILLLFFVKIPWSLIKLGCCHIVC